MCIRDSYYLSDEEWQPESTLDKSKITITAVTTYDNDLDLKFLEGYEMTPENGATNLQECVAIERGRFTVPTAFSSISYELVTRNSSHVEVGGINPVSYTHLDVYKRQVTVSVVMRAVSSQIKRPEAL